MGVSLNQLKLSLQRIKKYIDDNSNTEALNNEISRATAKETELQANINANVTSLNSELQTIKSANTSLDEKKADLSNMILELSNRYTKDQVYTKEEMLKQIEDLIGSAPETLNTFQEIADALGNDPNFATTIINQLSGKVDKVTGKQLTSNDFTNSDKAALTDVNSKKHSHSNKTVLDGITQGILDGYASAVSHIDNKSNPHGVTPAQIGASSTSHNHDGTYLKPTDSASDMVVNFDDTSMRENIVTGENIKTSFGKIKKWFSDLKMVAWTGNYNDLSNKPSFENISGIVSVSQGGTGAATELQARTNLGLGTAAIQNVADNCTTVAEGNVLDARQGKILMDKANQIKNDLDQVNLNLGGCIFETKSDGAYVTYTPAGGADPVSKKLGDGGEGDNALTAYEFYIDNFMSTNGGDYSYDFYINDQFFVGNPRGYDWNYDVSEINLLLTITIASTSSTCNSIKLNGTSATITKYPNSKKKLNDLYIASGTYMLNGVKQGETLNVLLDGLSSINGMNIQTGTLFMIVPGDRVLIN